MPHRDSKHSSQVPPQGAVADGRVEEECCREPTAWVWLQGKSSDQLKGEFQLSLVIKSGLCDTVTNSSYGLTEWMSWFLRGLLYPLISVLSCFNEDAVLVKVGSWVGKITTLMRMQVMLAKKWNGTCPWPPDARLGKKPLTPAFKERKQLRDRPGKQVREESRVLPSSLVESDLEHLYPKS